MEKRKIKNVAFLALSLSVFWQMKFCGSAINLEAKKKEKNKFLLDACTGLLIEENNTNLEKAEEFVLPVCDAEKFCNCLLSCSQCLSEVKSASKNGSNRSINAEIASACLQTIGSKTPEKTCMKLSATFLLGQVFSYANFVPSVANKIITSFAGDFIANKAYEKGINFAGLLKCCKRKKTLVNKEEKNK